ncbi:DUF2218 domain-containing protein [Thiopseudomonas denitrificans]|uniref:DUF2218 domain-containing protein n=1 Tax=Thiopseudomonas denitrificans TaxID=1501432 RepID=A0A4R6TWA9_9GAMM|nr:DUF2218 domain-containing protein [Thiopseudomonas denitrificans]TDQ36533.1 hypothetical protein DFQ45_11280 [Thiopseudomonas denitrificans]
MLTTYATLDTSEAHRLIKRLCAHWSHKLTVEAEDGLGRIDFGESRCLLTADTERLHIKLDCPDEAASGRMQQVVFDHLKRMAKAELAEPLWSSSNVE